ncbi:MAG: hypothetical protein WCD76_10250 [Pyrinomonadaceae bacterium]
MRRVVVTLITICFAGFLADGQSAQTDLRLPTLHVIKNATLTPTYGCRSGEEFRKGYWDSALFLTGDPKRRGEPDLLFNGACGSEDFFQASFSGDDMSLIADLGANVSLEAVSASRAFNLHLIQSYGNYSKFVQTINVELNHTYAVLLNRSNKRGLFVFTVTGYTPNKQVELKYAVKSYEVMTNGQTSKSPDFDWERKSAPYAMHLTTH